VVTAHTEKERVRQLEEQKKKISTKLR